MKHLPCPLWVAAALAASLSITSAAADPMRPLAAAGKASAAVAGSNISSRKTDRPPALGRLIAIRQDSRGQRRALIGDRWVGVGDTLDRVRVTAIGANQVEFVLAGATGPTSQTLHLLPPLQASGASGVTGSKTR